MCSVGGGPFIDGFIIDHGKNTLALCRWEEELYSVEQTKHCESVMWMAFVEDSWRALPPALRVGGQWI